ncbi:transposase [Methylorubrum salsuginis]|uniref:Transposase n=1 Tax=Methylorubrum salsuginis TaxID=414703 RepID=A0A1I4CJM6_9HYPH|nr:transposase [Methylorubrum salsuginis]
MQRRKFGREFKIEAVRLVRERGVSVAQAARDLDVHETMLHRWVKQAAADPQHVFLGQGQMKPEQIEMNFAFIAKHRAVWQVAWMCAALNVSRSGFHA